MASKVRLGVVALEASSTALLQPEWTALASETLQTLSAAEVERVASALLRHVDESLDAAEPAFHAAEPALQEGGDDAPWEGEIGSATATLTSAANLARILVADPARMPLPPSLLEASVALHDIIFDLHDARASSLQESIVDLCEAWWASERPGRDELVPQTISYLLVKVLGESASAADVKRLYAFRSALQVLDYADESIGPLKRLLLHIAIRPLVLRNPEGRKLLVYLFGLHPPFIAELHRSIKAQIPVCRKALRSLYGEVYFKAWRGASGAYLERIEEGCLQDLMFHAVHASSTAMATSLRQVLGHLHEQKRQKGVDQMLVRLYEPVLWRALKVANGHVRRNAAVLFIEAFPLQDPTLPVTAIDAQMQMQFDALHALCKDPCVSTRLVGVQGVCRVLALFWELIPTLTAKSLLTLLSRDLAHDASASAVRVGVFQGLKYLLANNTHPGLIASFKSSLAPLAPLIHDASERVRSAMLDLLLELAKVCVCVCVCVCV